jgi:hypothetical protein
MDLFILINDDIQIRNVDFLIKEHKSLYLNIKINNKMNINFKYEYLDDIIENQVIDIDIDIVKNMMDNNYKDAISQGKNGMYPGNNEKDKLYNYLICSIAIHYITLILSDFYNGKDDNNSPFYPIIMMMPTLNIDNNLLNINNYSYLEYYIKIIKQFDDLKINKIGKLLLYHLEEFWNNFGEYIIENGESETESGAEVKVDTFNDINCIYGSLTNLTSIINDKINRSNDVYSNLLTIRENIKSELKAELTKDIMSVKIDEINNNLNSISELEKINFSYLEKSEQMYDNNLKLEKKIRDIEIKVKDECQLVIDKHDEITNIYNELNVYTNELKDYVNNSKTEIVNYAKKNLEEISYKDIANKVNILVSNELDGIIKDKSDKFFKDMSKKYEYTIFNEVNSILSKKDKIIEDLNNTINDKILLIDDFKYNFMSNIKDEINILTDETLLIHNTISENILKFKGDMDKHINNKSVEIDDRVKISLERHSNIIIPQVFEETLKNMEDKIVDMIRDKYELEIKDIKKSLILISTKLSELQNR